MWKTKNFSIISLFHHSSIFYPLTFPSFKPNGPLIKMSLIPSFFGSCRTNILNPFLLEIWDPFKDFPFSYESQFSGKTSALVNTCVDWKETPEVHVFKADLLGLKKEEVKVEVKDDRVLKLLTANQTFLSAKGIYVLICNHIVA